MTDLPSQADGHPHRWRIQAAMLSLLVMAPLDASAVNIIFPVLQQEFHLPMERLGRVAWVSVAYLTVIAGLILPMGRLGDMWGFRRMYLVGGVVFVAASVLCGLAPGLGWLIGARVFQGIGACMMMALNPGITTAIFPAKERGRAMGIVAMTVAMGSMIGPTVGGLVTQAVGWRGVFFMNVPVGAVGLYLCWRNLPPLTPVTRARADLTGGLLAVVSLASLLLAVTEGNAWGWTSPSILALAGLAVITGGCFALHERRAAEPMLDFSLFRSRVFLGGNLASLSNYMGQMCAIFLLPVLLERGLGMTAAHAGLLYAIMPAMILFIAPVSGALSDRVGTQRLAVTGQSLILLGLGAAAVVLWLAGAGTIGRAAVLWCAMPAFAIVGAGAGVFQSPNNSAVMGAVPRAQLGIGGGVLAAMRNIGFACGLAVAGAAVGGHAAANVEGHPDQTLFHSLSVGLLAGAVFVFCGLLASLWRDDHPTARSTSA